MKRADIYQRIEDLEVTLTEDANDEIKMGGPDGFHDDELKDLSKLLEALQGLDDEMFPRIFDTSA